jgi:hypothetical protein
MKISFDHKRSGFMSDVAYRRRLIAFLVFMAVLTAIPSAAGQGFSNARSLGMAGSSQFSDVPIEAAHYNPANLGLPGRSNYSLQLLSVTAEAANNSFSLSDYNKYNGAYLTAQDKEDILDKIPTDGLNADIAVAASALSCSYGSLAFTSEVVGGGRGFLAREPIELILMGNRIGDPVSAQGTRGNGWSALSLGLSYGRQIHQSAALTLAAGASVRYLRGLAYFDMSELAADMITAPHGFTGSGGLKIMEGGGASGYAVDVGLAGTVRGTKVGLVARNLLASLNWNRGTKGTQYTFSFTNLTAENAADDTILVSSDEELPVASFTSRPPLEFTFAASRCFGSYLTSIAWRQGFENTAFVTTSPRLSAGVEYPLFSYLSVRSGLAVGGTDGPAIALGAGTKTGRFYFDIGYATASCLLPWNGNGGSLAVSSYLKL